MGNALDRGGGYTAAEYRDHFDAHCGMEVVLANGEVVRTGMGANPKSKTWQLFKYGMGPWIDGIFSQSNYGIVTKMGFWLMEEPQAALQVSVSVPRRADVTPLLDTLTSLMYANIIPSQANVSSPIMNGSNDAELVRLRALGAQASDADWARYAERSGAPFWTSPFCFFGPDKVIDAQWEHTRERLAAIPGVRFNETARYRFPLSDEAVEAVVAKNRLGIPSLNVFSSRNSPTDRINEGHLDFSPIIAPTGEELLAIADVTARVYLELGMPPPAATGSLFHPRGMTVFQAIPTFRNVADNRRSRTLFERLVTTCSEYGWTEYRVHPHFQRLCMDTYNFSEGSLRRVHETLKDALDPNGILSAGRYGIWPRHLRETIA
jgi:4-cresol dehydrogenase (hydroxylating)